MLASGTAWDAESSKPETQMAGKPACTANLAERGLCEDMVIHGLVVERRARRVEMFVSCWDERIEGGVLDVMFVQCTGGKRTVRT